MSKRQKNLKESKELKTSKMSDSTKSPVLLEAVTVSTPPKSNLKPPPSSPEPDEPGSSDLERLLNVTIENQEMFQNMLDGTQAAISMFEEAELTSDNMDLVEACAHEIECKRKPKKLAEEWTKLEPRIKFFGDNKPKAKASSNPRLSTPAMTPISPTTGSASRQVDAKEPTM